MQKISGDEFFDLIDKNQLSLVGEMSILSPDKTGLDIFVYVDDTGSFNTSGHNGSYRIKFQQDFTIGDFIDIIYYTKKWN